MMSPGFLLLFFPISMIVLVVLETCRSDDPLKIIKRSLANLGLLTGFLVVFGLLVFLLNRHL